MEHQRVEHERRLAEYRAIVDAMSNATTGAPADDPHVRSVVEFGIAYEQAFVDWLAQLPAVTTTS